jgi:hypothetical protein
MSPKEKVEEFWVKINFLEEKGFGTYFIVIKDKLKIKKDIFLNNILIDMVIQKYLLETKNGKLNNFLFID